MLYPLMEVGHKEHTSLWSHVDRVQLCAHILMSTVVLWATQGGEYTSSQCSGIQRILVLYHE